MASDFNAPFADENRDDEFVGAAGESDQFDRVDSGADMNDDLLAPEPLASGPRRERDAAIDDAGEPDLDDGDDETDTAEAEAEEAVEEDEDEEEDDDYEPVDAGALDAALRAAASVGDLIALRAQVSEGEEGLRVFRSVLDPHKTGAGADAKLLLASGQWVLGDHADAHETFDGVKGKEVQPFHRLAHGISAYSIGEYDAAEKLLQSLAGEKAPEAADAKSLLVELALARRGIDVIKDDFGPLRHYTLASGNGDALSAAEKLAKALKASDGANHHYANGLIHDARGEGREALECYRQAHEAGGCVHIGLLFRYAFYADLFEAEDDEGALLAPKLYWELRQSSTFSRGTMLNLGLRFEDEERYHQAAECYRTVLRQYPTDRVAKLFLKDAEASMSMYYDEDQERRDDKRMQLLRTPVTEFELSVRSRNCLDRMKIRTLGDLVQKTEQELLSYKNFGETSLQEIKQILASKNLRLGMLLSDGGPALQQEQPAAKDEILNKSIFELDLSVRIRKVMERLNITTVGDLMAHKEAELTKLKNFGKTSMAELKRKLAELGVTMRPT